jgi:hypothetical protein
MEDATGRQRVWTVLRHEQVDRVPRQLWALPGISMFRKDELDRLSKVFPSDIIAPQIQFGSSKKTSGVPNMPGSYTDEWGCIWHIAEPGVIGEVKEYAIPELQDVGRYELPWEILDEADFSQVNEHCLKVDQFVLAGSHADPFERMQFLRGTENLFMDLVANEPEIWVLRNKLNEFYLREMTMWSNTAVDGVVFCDDWGTQKSPKYDDFLLKYKLILVSINLYQSRGN